MNTPVDAKRAYLDAIAARSDRSPKQAPWVNDLRLRARTHFDELGFPTTRDEAWKYTNVAPLTRSVFQPASGNGAISRERLESLLWPTLEAHRLVFVDGRYRAELSALPALGRHGFVGSLTEALATGPDALEAHLGSLAPMDGHSFAALNTAFLIDGAYVRVPAGTEIERPIHVVYVSTQNALAQPHGLIVAEAGSRATVIEHYLTLDEGSYFTNALTEVVLERGSAIEHYRVQQEGAKGYHVGGLYVRQNRDSRFTSHAIDLGGLLVRNDVHSSLAAEGAECTLDGLYVADGRQHVDNHTVIDHVAPRGTSREFYKGVLEGRARAVFNGRVIVQPDAQQTDAQQVNNNLLLSEDAEVDTKPEFEIYADDVKCSHGATVGQLDADALFYLRSRSVDETAARDLLTFAFANDILSRFKLAPIRVALEKKLTSRLLRGREIKELELV